MDSEVAFQKYFEALIDSDVINLTPTQKRILQYISEKSFSNEPINELLIAKEVLYKDQKFDPSSDTSIRVHISNIRKKLDQYFQTDGKKMPFVVQIPKGTYHLKINDRSVHQNTAFKPGLTYFIIIILLLAALLIQFFYFKNKTEKLESSNISINNNSFWSEVISNEKPSLIVYHDIFFYDKINAQKGERYIVYNEKIETEEELDSLAATLPPGYRLSKSFDYVRFRSMKQLLDVFPILHGKGKKVEIKLLNELTPTDLTTHNIIFIGKHRKMGFFKNLLEKLGLNFSFFPHQIQYHSAQTDSVYTYKMQGQWQEFHNDLGVIAKIPGPNNNEIILLTSLHAVGNGLNQVVRLVSDPGSFGSLQSEITNEDLPSYFFALIKVSGYEETGFSHEVLHYGEIDEGQNIWID